MFAKSHLQRSGFVGNFSKRQESSIYYLYIHKTKLFYYKGLMKSCEFFIQSKQRLQNLIEQVSWVFKNQDKVGL